MYKVLIADDERLIRITLKNMIDWKALYKRALSCRSRGKGWGGSISHFHGYAAGNRYYGFENAGYGRN